jgi:hypothetical protein
MLTEQDYRKALVMRHPFWQMLSPTVVKRRIDQLLAAPDSQELVQALSPIEYTILLKEAPDMRPQLLQLAQPEQIRTVLDLDCWDKDTLQGARLLAWLEDLQRSGIDTFTHTLQVVDPEMLIAFLRQYIRVNAALPPEEEDEPQHYDEVMANELYQIVFVAPDDPLNDRIRHLLHLLRLADLDMYHRLMQGTMWEQDTELTEWAYRWKSGRLQDEGFLDYYDALETYIMLDLEHLTTPPIPPPLPGQPESAELSGLLPSYVWSLTPARSLLDRALTSEFSPETLERLCWEMVYLCNREFVYDQVDFSDATAIRTTLQRVHAYLNIGLEYLSGNDTRQLHYLLSEHTLQFICQVGFTLMMRLHQHANRMQRHLDHTLGIPRALPGLARHVLDGLLPRPPQFFEGLGQPGEAGYRNFLHVQEIVLVDSVLQEIETAAHYRWR